jgi:exodeoxyribonuclease VII large subunit
MTCQTISPPPGDGAQARASIAPEPPTLTLRALIDDVASAVRTGVPREAWVDAAVVSVRRRGGGYSVELGENDANLSPSGARLEAYLPERNLGAISDKLGLSDFDPSDLEKSSVIVRLTIHFNPRFHLQGVIQDINPAIGASLLAKHLQRIRAGLNRDGLLHAKSRLPAPTDIRRLAVIHPLGAAAWADVAMELERLRRAGVLDVVDIAATFEGPAAVASILEALRTVADLPSVDAVMLVRGGGASSGLAVLANEDLARAKRQPSAPRFSRGIFTPGRK